MKSLFSIPAFMAESMKLPFQKASVFMKESYYTNTGRVWTFE